MNVTPSAAAKRPPEIVLKIEKPADAEPVPTYRTIYFCFGPDHTHRWTTHRHEAFNFTDHGEAQRIADDHRGHVAPCDPEENVPLAQQRRCWLPYKDSPDD